MAILNLVSYPVRGNCLFTDTTPLLFQFFFIIGRSPRLSRAQHTAKMNIQYPAWLPLDHKFMYFTESHYPRSKMADIGHDRFQLCAKLYYTCPLEGIKILYENVCKRFKLDRKYINIPFKLFSPNLNALIFLRLLILDMKI